MNSKFNAASSNSHFASLSSWHNQWECFSLWQLEPSFFYPSDQMLQTVKKLLSMPELIEQKTKSQE